MRKILIPLLVVMTFLSACARENPVIPETDKPDREKVVLYYGDSNNEKFVTEKRDITFRKEEDKYTKTLQELIKGPRNEDYTSNIPRETKVYGTIRQGDLLIVDFNREFTRFGGSVAEIVGVGSVVNTLTEFKEINRVKILVEGSELIGPSGQPRGIMTPFKDPSEPETERPPVADKTTDKVITLYFANKDATAVAGEARTITVPRNIGREDYIKKILEELIKGPQRQDLSRTIPEEVRVKSVTITDNTASVDFSEEMHTKHWRGAAGEAMTINSIVNTLTELPFVKQVKMTVEGQPLAIEHSILDKPVGRNEKMIER